MYLARVTGSVVSSVKHDRFGRQRLLIVQRLRLDGSLHGTEDVALDPSLDAGVGDAVLVAKEGAVVAGMMDQGVPEGTPPTPANVIVVAVVDEASLPAAITEAG